MIDLFIFPWIYPVLILLLFFRKGGTMVQVSRQEGSGGSKVLGVLRVFSVKFVWRSCLCRFPSGTVVSSYMQSKVTDISKLPRSTNVSVNGCSSLSAELVSSFPWPWWKNGIYLAYKVIHWVIISSEGGNVFLIRDFWEQWRNYFKLPGRTYNHSTTVVSRISARRNHWIFWLVGYNSRRPQEISLLWSYITLVLEPMGFLVHDNHQYATDVVDKDLVERHYSMFFNVVNIFAIH